MSLAADDNPIHPDKKKTQSFLNPRKEFIQISPSLPDFPKRREGRFRFGTLESISKIGVPKDPWLNGM